MLPEQLLETMKTYFADLHEPEQLRDFETIRAADLIEDSMDAVTFVMHLEEKTRLHIPMSQAAALTGLTFQELARQLSAGELGVQPAAAS